MNQAILPLIHLRQQQIGLYRELLDRLAQEGKDIDKKDWKGLQTHREEEPFFVSRLEGLDRVIRAREKDLRRFTLTAPRTFHENRRRLDKEREDLCLRTSRTMASLEERVRHWREAVGREIASLKRVPRRRQSAFQDPRPARLDIMG